MMKKDPYLYTIASISMKHRLVVVGNHNIFVKKKKKKNMMRHNGPLVCFISKRFFFFGFLYMLFLMDLQFLFFYNI